MTKASIHVSPVKALGSTGSEGMRASRSSADLVI